MLFQRCGSPGFLAPEILRDRGYDEKVDIFSMGAVFYTITTSKCLFEGKFRTANELLLANRKCDLTHIP